MPPRSPTFLEVDEYERQPGVHRSRSNGYLDFLKEQPIWDRRDRELQMIRYRDQHGSAASQQRTSSDHLRVPIYEMSPRRPRAGSDTRVAYKDDIDARSFKTQEVRPEPKPLKDRDISSDPVLPSASHKRGSTHSKSPLERPKIKVQIVQENPPGSTTKDRTPGRSPSASPRSPARRGQLAYKYLLLQNRLADISLACLRFADVEAANPRDLTFNKIAEQVKGFAFELRVWFHVANIQNMPRIDLPENVAAVTDAASRNLDRLIDRATELNDACAEAKPNDLKFEGLAKVEDDDELFNEDDSKRSEQDPTESLGYIIDSSLHSIELQIRSLKRLTRSLQEATPDAKDEVVAVNALVAETERYFGSEEALKRHPIDTKFVGRRALDEAKYAAAR